MRIGALAPLSAPGWASAGRSLLAGLESHGVDLVVRDTAASPERAGAAVHELAALGVDALVGEFHSVAARAVAQRAVALGIPYLCSSAVIDRLVDEPTDLVARLSPPQSRGWSVFAEHLRDSGHTRVTIESQASLYWETGTRILSEHLEIVDLDDATAVLLLVGHPEPALSLVRDLRRARPDLLIAAPAGQPELAEWLTLGADGTGVPFLRYLPEHLGDVPSHVELEGRDAIAAVCDYLRVGDWSRVVVEGTRGDIRFSRDNDIWQWADAPIAVCDRDPARPSGFRVLRAG